MPAMKRFVTYIYSYENSRKKGNVGFAKMELRADVFRLEIHLRGLSPARTVCRVYFFRPQNGSIIGFPIGSMNIQNNAGDYSFSASSAQIGASGYHLHDMEGLLLLDEENQFFISRFRDGEPLIADLAHFQEWNSPAALADTDGTKTENIENSAAETRAAEPDVAEIAEAETNVTESSAVKTSTQKSSAGLEGHGTSVTATEVPMQNFFPHYRIDDVWETLFAEHPSFAPFEEKELLLLRIELKDLRELPRRFWYLGNNSFLLHGFFNYRYLVIGKCPNGRYFLGIPGIYQNQERVMAAIFGFPEFIPEALSDAPKTGEPLNRFGYWHRFLEEL